MSIYYKNAPDGKKLLPYLILMNVYIGILMKLLVNGLWIIFEKIPFELLGIITLVYVNHNFSDERSLHFC